MWRRAMIGHAVSNCMPVIAANRIGTEAETGSAQAFYGHSFITDEWGDFLAEFGKEETGVLVATIDRSEEHTSELQSLMRISYAVFCLKKKNTKQTHNQNKQITDTNLI